MIDLNNATKLRKRIIDSTSKEKRGKFSQYLTPKQTALLAASLFSDTNGHLECLDLGAGTGMLSVALASIYKSFDIHIDCVEVDPTLAKVCDSALDGVSHEIYIGDALTNTPNKKYDRIILNPPYKKMALNDTRQEALPLVAINYYIAFMLTAMIRLKQGGEMVAIIPRSWTNGDYFKNFRKWAFDNYSLDAIHIYGSRSEIFNDTDVLQETMIVKFSNKKQSTFITVSQSNTKRDATVDSKYKYSDLIVGESQYLRIAPSNCKLSHTFDSQGFCPSTGKIVDFRLKEFLYSTKDEELRSYGSNNDLYRLYYPGNFKDDRIVHPSKIGKYQWYHANGNDLKKLLLKPGCYVLVKRFTTKEEKKRVVAIFAEFDNFVALENHISFIHEGMPRNVIPFQNKNMAKGVTLWLNSTFIDEWFRDMSGNTQVNAKDIKLMPCPSKAVLCELGELYQYGLSQNMIDDCVRRVVWK